MRKDGTDMPRDESSFGANFIEHSVIKKPTGKLKLMKFLIVLGAIILTIGAIVATIAVIDVMGAYFAPIELLLVIILVYFVWKYTNIEYDYVIASGTMEMSAVYSGRKRKVLFSKKISEMTSIEKYSGNKSKYGKPEYKIYECVSSMEAPEIYLAEFTENGKKCVVFFETQKKTPGILKFYNSVATKI